MTAGRRVLQVVLSLNAGGTERLVVELVRRLQQDIPMAVCCLDEPGIWASELTSAGVPVDALHRGPGFVPQLGHAIAQLAARHGAAVAHCHHYSPFIYGGLARLWRPRMRMVYTEHGRLSDAPPSAKRRLANTVFGKLATAVFAVSEELRQHMVEEGFSERTTAVIYNGIDVGPLPGVRQRDAIRQELGVAEDTLVVGTIARLDPVKDLGTLIKAIALLAGTPVLLTDHRRRVLNAMRSSAQPPWRESPIASVSLATGMMRVAGWPAAMSTSTVQSARASR